VFKSFIFIPKDLLIDNNSSINTDIMNFLSIDCSTETGSLFIKTKSKTFIKVLQSDKFNNDLLMKQILDFFSYNNLEFEDISQIFVNQGPGSFSGLRASLATAKGISLSRNLTLFGYDIFLWSCVKFFNKKDPIYSLIKFREKYFIKKFNKNLKSLSEIEEVTENEIQNKYINEFKVIPGSVAKYFNKKILELNNLNVVNLDHNELEFLQLKDLLNEKLIKPLYLS